MFDFIVKNTFKLFARVFYHYKVLNKKNFPKKKQGALIVANHISYLDSFMIAGWTPRMVRFVLLKQIYEGKLHWLFKGVKIIPVTPSINKTKLDEFNERCREMIKSGELVYIYAEGEMTRVNYLLPFRKGLEYIAHEQDIDVIPLHYDNTTGSPSTYIPGTGKTYGFNFKTLQRKVIVNTGKPISHPVTAFKARQKMNELAAESFPFRVKDSKSIKWAVKKLMKRNKIASNIKKEAFEALTLVPEKYHRLFIYTLLAFDQVLKRENIKNLKKPDNKNDLFELLYNYFPCLIIGKKVPVELGYWKLPESFAIVCCNATDMIAKDVTGSRIRQICNKPDSVGRPLPGIAIKTVDQNNLSKELEEDQTGILLIKGYIIDCNPDLEKSKIIDGWYNTGVLGFIDFDGFVYLKS